MIFEQISENAGNLIAYRWDFGVPVTFIATNDDIPFTIGDKIVFTLNSDPRIEKQYNVDNEDFSFDLMFTQGESNMLANSGKSAFVFSFKQYSEKGEFLDTIMNGKLILKETLHWEE